jgi:hypothetical protein
MACGGIVEDPSRLASIAALHAGSWHQLLVPSATAARKGTVLHFSERKPWRTGERWPQLRHLIA